MHPRLLERERITQSNQKLVRLLIWMIEVDQMLDKPRELVEYQILLILKLYLLLRLYLALSLGWLRREQCF